MFSTQLLSPTRFDLNFSLFGIPVRVHPLFWAIALLLGGRNANLLDILLWTVAVFLSVLLHELGHALAMRYYGQGSSIILHATGGLTVPQPVGWGTGWANVRLTSAQEIIVTAAGPGAGFLFAVLILFTVRAFGGVIEFFPLLGFIPFPLAGFAAENEILNSFIVSLLWVNVIWGVFNLLPVYPLDGGQIARHLFMIFDPRDGARKALWLSAIVGGLMALMGFTLLGSFFMALLFGMMAFQSYQLLTGRGGY